MEEKNEFNIQGGLVMLDKILYEIMKYAINGANDPDADIPAVDAAITNVTTDMDTSEALIHIGTKMLYALAAMSERIARTESMIAQVYDKDDIDEDPPKTGSPNKEGSMNPDGRGLVINGNVQNVYVSNMGSGRQYTGYDFNEDDLDDWGEWGDEEDEDETEAMTDQEQLQKYMEMIQGVFPKDNAPIETDIGAAPKQEIPKACEEWFDENFGGDQWDSNEKVDMVNRIITDLGQGALDITLSMANENLISLPIYMDDFIKYYHHTIDALMGNTTYSDTDMVKRILTVANELADEKGIDLFIEKGSDEDKLYTIPTKAGMNEYLDKAYQDTEADDDSKLHAVDDQKEDEE